MFSYLRTVLKNFSVTFLHTTKRVGLEPAASEP